MKQRARAYTAWGSVYFSCIYQNQIVDTRLARAARSFGAIAGASLQEVPIYFLTVERSGNCGWNLSQGENVSGIPNRLYVRVQIINSLFNVSIIYTTIRWYNLARQMFRLVYPNTSAFIELRIRSPYFIFELAMFSTCSWSKTTIDCCIV